MLDARNRRILSVVLGITVSAGAILTLLTLVSPRDLSDAFAAFHPYYLLSFTLMVILMVACFGYRWHILLQGAISTRLAIRAMLINMGGNMVLPLRGGDLLRIHFSHAETKAPAAVLFGALLTEKAADLLAICLIGAVGAAMLGLGNDAHWGMIAATAGVFLFVLATAVLLRRRNDLVQALCFWIFRKLRKPEFYRQHVSRLVASIGENLGLRTFAKTMTITLFLWLVIYSGSYLCIASLVGVSLSYPEALIVLWASGLGLMIPAAPSGLGVYHATVVSVFYILGRPIAEGLVLATALHLSFFVALVLPMGVLYGKWLFKKVASR